VRLVAVLGYSNRRTRGLHELCAVRLRHAEQLVADNDAVLLSGWSRRRGDSPEADLMRRAWNGGKARFIEDVSARSTRENATSVAEAARRIGATEVTVVTSGWHAYRARSLVRAALAGTPVETSSPGGRASVALRTRELACLATLPYHLTRLRAARWFGR
jgi:uncharacterized SAM-binding protein YcdF (DUF218 family)